MSEITINLHDIPCGNCTVCIGRTIGAKHEQERIIKLLEEHTLMVDEGTCWCLCGEPEAWYGLDYQDHQIALIKGEK